MNIIDIFLEDSFRTPLMKDSPEEGMRLVEFAGYELNSRVTSSVSAGKLMKITIESVQDVTASLLNKQPSYSTIFALIHTTANQTVSLLSEANRNGIHGALIQLTDPMTDELETLLQRQVERGAAMVLVR